MKNKKKNQKKYNKGILGTGTDYSFYKMTCSETALVCCASVIAGVLAFGMFFGFSFLALIFGAVIAVVMQRPGTEYFKKKRNKNLLIQFRDFLESLSSSLSAGQNISMAIKSAGNDMVQQYGEEAMMSQEVMMITNGMENNYTAEDMFIDFAQRSHQRDIMSFAETFQICNRTGGNMKNIIKATYKILSDKMAMEAEIATTASKGKNDLLIMTCMPFIILPMMKSLGGDMAANNMINVTVKVIGAVLIAISYIIGSKIAQIKI